METESADNSDQEYDLRDSEGNMSRYRVYHGHRFPPRAMMRSELPTLLEGIRTMVCRDEDVVIATFPKSGTNWVANIVSMLLHGNHEYIDAPPCLEYTSQEAALTKPSPRIFFSHLPFEYFPRQIREEGKSKLICVFRDPRDVLASYYNFILKLDKSLRPIDGTWSGCFKFYLNNQISRGTWFDYMKMWLSTMKKYPDLNVLFLSYEDMKMNLYENVVKIAKHLGTEHNDSFYQEIAKKCTFATMQPNMTNVMSKEWEQFKRRDNNVLYRKGEIGDWKNWFTVAQSEEFEAAYQRELGDRDTSHIYKWNPHL